MWPLVLGLAISIRGSYDCEGFGLLTRSRLPHSSQRYNAIFDDGQSQSPSIIDTSLSWDDDDCSSDSRDDKGSEVPSMSSSPYSKPSNEIKNERCKISFKRNLRYGCEIAITMMNPYPFLVLHVASAAKHKVMFT